MEPITALAMAGATTLVAAMATSAWESTREAAVRLFRRDPGPDDALLDTTAARVQSAADPAATRERIVPLWQGEFENLLQRHPEALEEVRSFITQTRGDLPPDGLAWVQNVTAYAGGSAYGASNGNVIVHHHAASPHHPAAQTDNAPVPLPYSDGH
ncbi:hypothetical protein ACQKM2_37050 [Streptomyces sp. NPDC004126]|uniref:hypothetical protein n=1 Tax=Streptomyces sp. NPDC004126 TaxID=3390695 RepID=UPI003CFC0D2C